MGRIRKPTLLKLIAQVGGYRIKLSGDYTPIEPPPAELAARLIDVLPQIGECLNFRGEDDEDFWDDFRVREQAFGTLARVWQIAPVKVLPILMRNLHNPLVLDSTHWLVRGLAEKIPEAESLIALLIGYLDDPNSQASQVAASALAACGPAASAAIPALLEVVANHPGHPEAALALWRVGQRLEALPGLIAATKRLHGDELLMTIGAIGEIGPSAAEAGPALLELVARRRHFAAAIDDALQKIGSIKMRMPAGELIEIAAPEWPSKESSIRPGDLSQFLPKRDGSLSQPQDPLPQADVQQGRGGIIYFVYDRDLRNEIPVILGAMGVKHDWRKYAVFIRHATDPKTDGYLTQLRIVTHFALHRLFEAIASAETLAFPEQPLPIGELVCGFVEKQREEWDSLPEHLRRHLGNDRVGMIEEIGFGLMVEDVKYGVYRLWSRPWLNLGNPLKPFQKSIPS